MPEDLSNLKMVTGNSVYMVFYTVRTDYIQEEICVYFDPEMDVITTSIPESIKFNPPRTPTDEERAHLLAAVLKSGLDSKTY